MPYDEGLAQVDVVGWRELVMLLVVFANVGKKIIILNI